MGNNVQNELKIYFSNYIKTLPLHMLKDLLCSYKLEHSRGIKNHSYSIHIINELITQRKSIKKVKNRTII